MFTVQCYVIVVYCGWHLNSFTDIKGGLNIMTKTCWLKRKLYHYFHLGQPALDSSRPQMTSAEYARYVLACFIKMCVTLIFVFSNIVFTHAQHVLLYIFVFCRKYYALPITIHAVVILHPPPPLPKNWCMFSCSCSQAVVWRTHWATWMCRPAMVTIWGCGTWQMTINNSATDCPRMRAGQ